MSKASHMHIDLTGDDKDDDESLSDLSDLSTTPPAPMTLPKSAPSSSSKQPSAVPQVVKSASSSTLAKPTSKPKSAAKPTAEGGDKKVKRVSGATGKVSRGNILQVDDVVSSRTHVNTGEEGSVVKLCHHHHQSCKGALLECTFMRAPGKRCQKRYCFSVLRRIYDQDPDTIVRSGRLMINPEEHCAPSEAKYAWKCPGCRSKCQCAVCRKAAGLTPLGQWNNIPKNQSVDTDTAAIAATESKPNKKNKVGDLLEAGSRIKAPAAKSKAASQAGVIDVDATPPVSSSSAKKKAAALSLTPSKPKTPVFKRLIPPAEAPAPSLEIIPTRLPEENLRARMWIYESFVRFDRIGLGRSALNQLDKFDSWTHALVQELLACLLKTIAGLSHIEKGQPTKTFVQAVAAYRRHAKNLQRGEPWSAAKQLLDSLGIAVTPLEYVEHSVPVEVEILAAQRSPSPLPLQRASRARRAKEGNSSRMATQVSMLNDWEANGFSDLDEEDDDEPPRKRTRGNNRKSMYVYDDDDESDEDASIDDPDAGGIRRSSRARKPVVKAGTPEVRLTGRQQTLKIQQEQQKETEEQAKRETQTKARERQQARFPRKPSADVSDVSMEETGAEFSIKGEIDDEAVPADPEETTFDLEAKVAIIHSLIDASLMTEPLSEELKTAGDNIAAMERTQKVEHAEMEKEIAEELAELNKRAPSIVAPEHQVWKAEKAKLETDIAWRRLDSRVITSLAVDTHSLRTGSLGVDADGREYWHLREYQERMPKFTEGRYAWSLIVLGTPFPDHSSAQADETASEIGNDSGASSLDSDVGSSEPVILLQPHNTNGDGARKHALTAEIAHKKKDRVCMGTNDPILIRTLADFVTYRLQRVEYEENQAMQDREREVRMGKDAIDGASQPSSPSKQSSPSKAGDDSNAPESMYAIRKAKQQLRDSQEERRTAVQHLVQRLQKSKDYFAWHRMELPPPGPAST